MAESHKLIIEGETEGPEASLSEMGEPTVDALVSFVGVRSVGSSNVLYRRVDDPEIESGTWVVIRTGLGDVPAQVVISPKQIVFAQLPDDLDVIVRVIGTDIPLQDPDEMAFAQPALTQGGRLIGGLGSFGTPSNVADSVEDALYRQTKDSLPSLGQRVVTEAGEGMVIAQQVFKATVTIRYDETGLDETVPVADITA